MDMYKKLLDEKIKLAKDIASPRDAFPLIEFILKYGHKLTDDDRKKLHETVEKSFERVGKVLMDRALSDGTISEEEYKQYKKLGLNEIEIGTVLQGYYNKKDGMIGDEIICVLTQEYTPIFKHRKMLCKKFGIDVASPRTLMEKMGDDGDIE